MQLSCSCVPVHARGYDCAPISISSVLVNMLSYGFGTDTSGAGKHCREDSVARFLDFFPFSKPQEVLLLHEVEALVKFVPPEACGAVLDVILPKVMYHVFAFLICFAGGGRTHRSQCWLEG